MPIEEMVMAIVMSLGLFISVLALTSMVLSHRRQMAEIKHGAIESTQNERALTNENVELRETVSLMQDRLAVLEQIAIDPARRTAEEIEKLR